MATIPQLQPVKVNLSDVHVDQGINSRKKYDETKDKKLADSIKVQGLMHPPVIMRLPSKEYPGVKKAFLLVAGFRRFKALDSLGVKDSNFSLGPDTWTLKDGVAANLVENLDRDDITNYEIAMQCAMMRKEFKMGPGDIAKAVRAYDNDPEGKKALSETHINNLIRCVENLAPPILKAWEEGHARASVRTLIKLSAMKAHDEQLAAWKAILGQSDETKGNGGAGGEGGEGGEGDSAPAKKARPTAPNLLLMIEAVRKSGHGDEYKNGAIAALRYAAGVDGVTGIPGVEFDAKRGGDNTKKDGGGKGPTGKGEAGTGDDAEGEEADDNAA